MNEEIIPTILEEPEEVIRTVNEDVIIAGVQSLNGETGDLTLKTVNGNELLGEGDIEITNGVTSVNGATGDVTITAADLDAATTIALSEEINAREQADTELQSAINGKQTQLTQPQLDAVNSGIDSTKVDQIATNTSNISSLSSSKQDKLTQTQLNAANSGIDSTKVGQIATNATDISTIEGKIPSAATSSNQLADKNFVNSSVATNTAYYISDNGEPFDSLADLEAYSGPLTNNDYAFVVGTDSAGNTTYTRYKYNADTGEWAEEYVLNNSSFTATQWGSINSGVTSDDVTKLAGIESGAEVNVQANWNETDSSSDAYIQNKPTIPPDMVVLSYGTSTWNDFITAYNKNVVVYCRASSNSNPGTGSQTRMAFMAYVNNATAPTEVEFQYYRSVSTHTAAQQGDQVFVYKLNNSGTWSVTTREAASKIVAGTNMSSSYSSGTLTLDATDTTYSAFTGTDGTSAGTAGLVPAPATTDADKFLKSDGTWDTAGGSSITVETTPGISDTSVMSQKAVTGMIFRINANDYSDHAIKIGGQSTTSNSAVAIGYKASSSDNYTVTIGDNANSRRWGQVSIGSHSGGAVSGAIYGVSVGYQAQQSANISGAIALGAYSKPTATGEMNIGSTETSYGYNSSNYRLITGVYDGQSAHDACTKGQLDTAVGNVESILQTLNSGNGAA